MIDGAIAPMSIRTAAIRQITRITGSFYQQAVLKYPVFPGHRRFLQPAAKVPPQFLCPRCIGFIDIDIRSKYGCTHINIHVSAASCDSV